MASAGIGCVLKEERLRQNMNVEEISRLTCIAPRFIEAIEQSDFSRLPAVVFTRSFVRQYSIVLNLDPAPLLAKLPKPDIENAPLPDPPPASGRRKWDPRFTSALQTTFLIAAAVGAGTLAWTQFNSLTEQGSYFLLKAWRVRQVRAPLQSTVKAAAPAAVTEEELPSRFSIPLPLEQAPVEEAILIPVATTLAAANPVEVTVAAREASWVQIIADGKTAYTGTLNPNEARTIGASGKIKVVTGNAGGVDISLNGKKLESLGLTGQARSVTLTSDGPLAAAQTPPVSGQF